MTAFDDAAYCMLISDPQAIHRPGFGTFLCMDKIVDVRITKRICSLPHERYVAIRKVL